MVAHCRSRPEIHVALRVRHDGMLLRAEPPAPAPTDDVVDALEVVGQEQAVPLATQVLTRSRLLTGPAEPGAEAVVLHTKRLNTSTPQRLQHDVESRRRSPLGSGRRGGRRGRGTLDLGQGIGRSSQDVPGPKAGPYPAFGGSHCPGLSDTAFQGPQAAASASCARSQE